MPLQATMASATALVPAAKGATSNMPMGPFQNTSSAALILAPYAAAVSGPMSSPIQPSGMASAGTSLVAASASAFSATTISVGSAKLQ